MLHVERHPELSTYFFIRNFISELEITTNDGKIGVSRVADCSYLLNLKAQSSVYADMEERRPLLALKPFFVGPDFSYHGPGCHLRPSKRVDG